MAGRSFRPGTSPNPEPGGAIAVLSPRRERLAIVSTSNKLCGIAAYTAALERQLVDIFDVTVADLDQYLLRSQHPKLRLLGDRHIKEICRVIAEFDVVNLQLEYGTLGYTTKDVYRRFCWLIAAAPRLSVTFHSLKRPPPFHFGEFARAIVSGKRRAAFDRIASFVGDLKLSFGLAKRLRRMQRRKPVSIIVHNRRDLADARHLHAFDRVFDHPLVFLSRDEAAAISNQATRRRFPTLDDLSAGNYPLGVP